ncbi:unnamed protein product [Leptidea sinapis]|uniref:Uncharacterized protein n=1 Tax=Leptidea sinapis TaxID=189913 RepID=A0A5E4QL49_9NEOP|nr:unnamed protein product [Leptidea sinapis]
MGQILYKFYLQS